MTNPTAGGITASFDRLGDISIGEPKAINCFCWAKSYTGYCERGIARGISNSRICQRTWGD